jgi:hypothetical protein
VAGPVPKIALNPAVGPPGTITTVTGTGFPANTAVSLGWAAGVGTAEAHTDAQGAFTTELVVVVPDVLGPRQAVATQFPTAKAPFLVVPSTSEPGGSGAVPLFRSEGP